MVVLRVSDTGETKVADFEVTGRVQQQVRRLEVAVQHIRRVYVLETAQYLVEEVTYVVIAETLQRS